MYKHWDDIDLFVGGFLEYPAQQADPDSALPVVGPTFQCIIGDTFVRLK